MEIKKVVVPAGHSLLAGSILPGLEQLGLQICDQLVRPVERIAF